MFTWFWAEQRLVLLTRLGLESRLASQLILAGRQRDRVVFQVTGQGSFTRRKVHASWTTALMLTAFDYYSMLFSCFCTF